MNSSEIRSQIFDTLKSRSDGKRFIVKEVPKETKEREEKRVGDNKREGERERAEEVKSSPR